MSPPTRFTTGSARRSSRAALPPESGGLELARETIRAGMEILARSDYAGYDAHCVEAKSDARDAGQVFRYLGASSRHILTDLHNAAE